MEKTGKVILSSFSLLVCSHLRKKEGGEDEGREKKKKEEETSEEKRRLGKQQEVKVAQRKVSEHRDQFCFHWTKEK